MSRLSIVYVVLALLAFTATGALGASRSPDAAASNAPYHPLALSEPTALLVGKWVLVVNAPKGGGLAARLYGSLRTSSARTPDTIADCLQPKQQSARATAANFSGVPAQAQPREIHF